MYMRIGLVTVMVLLSAIAHAQKPEMVLLPRILATAAAGWIAEPNAGNAVKMYEAMVACLANNPTNGVIQRMGQDACPAVTAAIEERDKEIADLKKQLDAAKKSPPVADASPAAKKD